MGHYTFVEEIALADCAIDVEGADLPDLFETAALALADVMVDPASVRTTVRRRIALDADEPDLLLYDWLSELIFRKDRDAEVYTRTKVDIDGNGPFRLAAEVEGGHLDPANAGSARTRRRSLSASSRSSADGGWRARIVIDI
jgi:SHS2 domain-containing protein